MALSPDPADTPTVLPSGSADAEQALGLGSGPHSVKLTFPVGGPLVALPVTVAVTVLVVSSGTLELAGAAVIAGALGACRFGQLPETVARGVDGPGVDLELAVGADTADGLRP